MARVGWTGSLGHAPASVLALMLAFMLSACGGSSGGGGSGTVTFSNATLSGTYTFVCLGGGQAGARMRAVYGTVTADGMGTLTGTTGENVNGLPGLLTAFPPTAYTVGADSSFTFSGLDGYITGDGEVAVAASMTAASEPMFCILLRRSGAYTNTSLSGNYAMAGMEGDNMAAATYWTQEGVGLGPIIFNGAGGATYPGVGLNNAGTVSTVGGGPSSYAINPDGAGTLGASWFGEGLGGLSSDGSLALFAGSTTATDPFLAAFIEQGAGMTAASFSGTYLLVGLEVDTGANPDFTAFLGLAQADGAGMISFPSLMQNVEGAIVPPITSPAPYTVGPTGILAAGNAAGAVSQDGRFAVLAGGTSNGNGPLFLFFARR